MIDLIARIESADGPSRELDAEIARSIGWGCVVRDPEAQGKYVCWRKHYRSGEWIMLPRYTASIDAALTLVPEGWRPYSADMSIKGRTRFLIEGPKTEWSTDDEGEKCAGNDWYAQGVAATPALALAAAALKARGV